MDACSNNTGANADESFISDKLKHKTNKEIKSQIKTETNMYILIKIAFKTYNYSVMLQSIITSSKKEYINITDAKITRVQIMTKYQVLVLFFLF